MSQGQKVNFGSTVTLNQLRKMIPVYAPQVTMVIQSEPGCGKSSLLAAIAEDNGDAWRKPGDVCPSDRYDYIYVDCPVKDSMDVGAYIPNRDAQQLEFFASELFMLKSSKPKVVMLDEMMKSQKMLQIIWTRLMLEKMAGDVPLPEGSYIFATSNNSSDGVGDGLLAHAGNRVMLVRMAKPTPNQWLNWAAGAGISTVIRTWVALNQRCLASYLDGGQEDNPYIFKPGNKVLSFVSPRSLAKSDVVVRHADQFGSEITQAALAGVIGHAAAESMAAYISLEKEIIPTVEALRNPETALIPEKIAAQFMMALNALEDLQTQDDLSSFMTYMKRMKSEELRSLFFSQLMSNKRTARLGRNNAEVCAWVEKNFDLI
jgi:hypothetical protein